MIIDLLNDIKEIRNDMVAKNYPYQQLTNLIMKWEEKLNIPANDNEDMLDNLDPYIPDDGVVFTEGAYLPMDQGDITGLTVYLDA